MSRATLCHPQLETVITLELITPENALLFKAVRLRALQDTPAAFGSTYAKEETLTDADWIKRASQWTNERAAAYLAMDGDAACGIAGVFLDQEDAMLAHLGSMWTAPTHRRRGVGRLLVNEIIGWVHRRKVRTLQLMVVCNNQSAILFYQRLGFALTGQSEPYPNDPKLIEYEMVRSIV